MNKKYHKIYEFEIIDTENKKTHWFKSLISDERGSISSKRIIGIISALSLIASLIISLITQGKYAPNSILIDSVALLSFGALGLTSIDKIGWRRNNNNNYFEEE